MYPDWPAFLSGVLKAELVEDCRIDFSREEAAADAESAFSVGVFGRRCPDGVEERLDGGMGVEAAPKSSPGKGFIGETRRLDLGERGVESKGTKEIDIESLNCPKFRDRNKRTGNKLGKW